MNTSKTYKKWEARVLDTKTPWTQNEIIYFRKAIGSASTLRRDERISVWALFRDTLLDTDKYSLTDEQSSKGTRYLLNNSIRKDGSTRKGCILGIHEIGILLNETCTHFLVGYYQIRCNPDYYVPIYRAETRDGRYFDYTGTTYSQIEVLNVS